MRCLNCGRENSADARFCDACGVRLAAGSAAAGQPAPTVRATEVATLEALLARAAKGHGAIVALAGEPGIGKTHCAQALASRVSGAVVLWGRCNEEPGAPPYWPWLQILRAWLETHDDTVLRSTLGTAAAPIADILPELEARLGRQAPQRPSPDPRQQRFRLFDAISGFCQRVAAIEPLLLIIDNLHWADASSLRLLEFLAAGLGTSRILLLVTYRDIELGRRHPLSATLGDLARHSHFQRLRLAGLSRQETAALVLQAGGGGLSPALLDALHTQTEGNPLFIIETTRLLVQEGLLDRTAPPTAAALGPQTIRIPEGVRDVIGRRLNRLSPLANRILTLAALIGRGFELTLLERVLERRLGSTLEKAIAESLEAHVLEPADAAGRLQFSHALIRETLYEEIAPPERSRLHLQVAQAIEALHGADDELHLPALAYHYASALPGGDPGHAAEIARRAALCANRQLAHEEAARLYRLALQALVQGPSRDNAGVVPKRAELLNALGQALAAAGEYLQAREAYREALDLARAAGASDTMATAALGFEAASWAPGLPGQAAARLLRAALDAQDGEDSTIRAQLLSALTRALIFSGEDTQAALVHEQALGMARRCSDAPTLVAALMATLSLRWHTQHSAQRLRDATEAIDLAERAGDATHALEARAWQLFELMELGDLTNWRAALARFERRAQEAGQPFPRYVAATSRATHALMQGRFEDAECLIAQALQLGRHMPGLDAPGVYGMQMFTLRSEQGRLGELAPLVRSLVAGMPEGSAWRPGLALLYAEIGLRAEAQREFDALAADDFGVIRQDGLRTGSLAYLAQVCAWLGERKRAASLYELLRPYDGRNLLIGTTVACLGAAASLLGLLATTLHRWDEAQRHFESALALNAAQGAEPALAHTRLRFAAMRLARKDLGDEEAARQLLTEAHAAAMRLDMRALLARIEALQQTLGASALTSTAAPPAGLSLREAQVLQLVAAGLGNREIARRLFVSPNTVANHVRAILTKTESANRTEAAAFAIRHGIAGG